jgi:hypothetical protein
MQKKAITLVFMSILVMVIAAGCDLSTVVQENTPAPTAVVGTPAPTEAAGTPAAGGQINVPGVTIQLYAPGPNPLVNTADAHGRPAGILLGIWHGVISPVTLVLSFLNKGTQMYEVHNDGSPYNLGFFLGVFILLALGGFVLGRR